MRSAATQAEKSVATDFPDDHALLLALAARVAALEARQPRPVDLDGDTRLLAAIAGSRGAEVFSVADLLASSDPELRAVLGSIGPRQLGAQLRRLSRGPCGPYQLTRIKREAAGTQWSVVYV